MELSKQSREFLENLRGYLVFSGKNEKEIEEIVSELEDHLYEAEQDGKSVTDIVGKTPKEYMEQLAGEMKFDFLGLLKYVPILILGVLAYIVMGDAIRGTLHYSLLSVIGYTVVVLVCLLLLAALGKYISSSSLSKTKQWLLCSAFGLIQIGLFIGIIFLDQHYRTYVVEFGKTGTIAAIVVSSLIFVGLAIWTKSWFSIMIPAVLYLPEAMMKLTGMSKDIQTIISSLLTFFGLGIVFFLTKKQTERDEKESNQ